MHLADALVSPAVAGTAALISIGALIAATRKVKDNSDTSVIPLMGVMGAFVFAAQMINFSIPGTGSSGHIIGGVLLAAMLGPWAALITLASVIVVQCLMFADGGLMALGCNILNMGICTTLLAYPLIYQPIVKSKLSAARIMTASVAACITGLEAGAVLVTVETELSGVTALNWTQFLGLMTGIHLLIGLGEGIATGLVLCYVFRYNPQLLRNYRDREPIGERKVRFNKKVIWTLAAVAVVLAISFTWIASGNPDGLEWSIEKLTGSTELIPSSAMTAHEAFAGAQASTSLLPDYESSWSGIVGCTIVVAIVWAVSSLIFARKRINH